LIPAIEGSFRPGTKLIALVSILGISAYLLFTPESTEPYYIKARSAQSTDPKPSVQSPSLAPQPTMEMPPIPVAIVGAPDPPPITTFELVSGLPGAMEKATPTQRRTADQLLKFVTGGAMADIRDLTRDEVLSLAELLTTELGPDVLATAVESYFGLPPAQFLAFDNPAEALTDLLGAVQANTGPTNAGPVIFSDQVRPDGSVTGNVHVIPPGTKRVYAAFENAGAMQGRDQVLAVWRNPSDDRMVFTEYEPVRSGSAYNYVWLELDDGWPTGFYQLDLFDASQPSRLLASRSFNVR
jgi:hypothetical protein